MNKTTINIAEYSFEFDEIRGILTTSDGRIISADSKKISYGEYSVLVNGKSFHIFLSQSQNSANATVNNFIFEIQKESLQDRLSKKLRKDSGGNINAVTLRAPMPGLITKVLLTDGIHVNAGDGILIVEAMKMENEIKAPRTGVIKKIFVKEKQTVEKNDNLFTIE
jgi:biotin carboxyl carrier protein